MRAVKVRKLRARCLIAWESFPYKQAISYKHFWRKFKKEYA